MRGQPFPDDKPDGAECQEDDDDDGSVQGNVHTTRAHSGIAYRTRPRNPRDFIDSRFYSTPKKSYVVIPSNGWREL